ncbi:MAG: protein kinase [Planctomycetaceae bacterium]|nr:protein kinase [Planctomycetaceae bacterium]MCA9020856.1 protein kinase [Planctomycetaceae bacterium]
MFHLIFNCDLHPLESSELILIGRGNACDIQIEDPAASRVHCRVLAREGKVFLTDASSRWGTFVNGKQVEDAELGIGDRITIGETDIYLAAESAPEVVTLPPKRIADLDLFSQGNSQQNELQPVKAGVQNPALSLKPFVPASYLHRSFLQYELHTLIANTRTGMTFAARDFRAERDVALKLFRPDLFYDETMRRRFLRAVQTMMTIQHSRIIRMHDAGLSTGLCYTVSEYVQGTSAAGMIKKIGIAGMLDWRTVTRIGIDICRALEVIHAAGIVHRNIKPEHILVYNESRQAMLGDVTLAKAWNHSQLEQITTEQDIVGDLAWQSPEQLGSGEPVDHRSDLYQLGVTLYALLTGENPFSSRRNTEVIEKILSQSPAPPKTIHLAIPDLLEDVVLRSLKKSPVQRNSSATEMKIELQRVLEYSV